MRLTLLLVLFTLLVNVAFHRPLLESFLFAVALAVGLTPELQVQSSTTNGGNPPEHHLMHRRDRHPLS